MPQGARGGHRGPTLLGIEEISNRPAIARAMIEARLRLGWSQYDLARACGIHQTSIATYEVGSSIRPGPNSRAKIERALGIELPPNEPRPERPLTPAQLEQAKRVLGCK